ncbi:MAG: serine protease [Bacteroidetes bacterium 4572_77]|nr:MAG: serine protease [Bacteroidetes bacterium 4572_77]
MKKLIVLVIALVIGFQPALKADEGMWVPMFLKQMNIKDMKKKGFKLSAEDVYSVNQSSLKDAIIIFGGGCTGEIVSPEGLIFTNHHCGYGSIQKVSTIEHDYLTDGFWSKNKSEEIAIEDLSVKFLVRMDDVTAKMLEGVSDTMTEGERNEVLAANEEVIIEEATKDNHFKAIVENYFAGNEYYLVIYEVFTDIRLVGTPPEAVGKFGADTDNWMWPRHTGDFSVFRVYMAPDGSPADYSKDNVPYKSKHYLPISIKDRKPGDFVFIMGNPGSTQRYLTSYGVDQAINESNPAVVKIRTARLDVMREFMDADPSVRLQYASKFARTANYWKYFQGQTKALKQLKVADEKRAIEESFQAWADADEKRKEKYGEVVDLFKDAYAQQEAYNLSQWYFREAFYRGTELVPYAASFRKLGKLLSADTVDQEKVDAKIAKLRGKMDSHFKDYYKPLDEKMLAETMSLYFWDIPQDQQPEILIEEAKKCQGDFYKMAGDVFRSTHFADRASVEALLDNPTADAINNDPAIALWNGFIGKYMEMKPLAMPVSDDLAKANRLFVAGLREQNPDKKYYPDANFTMRLTYGTVGGYSPADAEEFKFYTTTDGILQKEDPNNPEFVVPAKLKELILAKDFGPYANKNGEMPVGFLSDNDITGGNSGSPIMDAHGNLVGLAFDGNWEAMSGDIAFDPKMQKTINVDARYVLFIIDKLGGAQNIIDELTIVK